MSERINARPGPPAEPTPLLDEHQQAAVEVHRLAVEHFAQVVAAKQGESEEEGQ